MRKMRFICICLAALVLGACNGDKQTADDSTWQTAGLYYSYPCEGQNAVSLHAPVVLRFSEPVTSENPEENLTWTGEGGQNVEFSLETTEDGRSLVLTPDDALEPATEYVISAKDLETEIGGAAFPEGGISFTTRAAKNGPGDRVSSDVPFPEDGPFQVARMIPDGENLPLMDFSTLRLQFTQPVDKSSVHYGDSGTVTLEDDQGGVIEANVITSGAYMTIDPVSDLEPGAVYHLKLSSGLTSTTDSELDQGYYDDLVLQPRDSKPRETLVQKVPAADEAAGQLRSPLTGMPVNCVPIRAVLLGDQGNSTQQTGDVHAELAFAPNYPEVTPLRVPRGSLLTGTNLQVNIGGEVPAGYETGDISVKFVSDASGYLMPNPYSDDTEAPRQIRLYMDIAMNTAGAKANGGMSQDLLHVELVGTSIVKDGVMVINAMGVIEPEVLGLEEAYGILSFHMKGYRDQDNAPAMAEDMTPPAVQSWVPGGETQAEATENAKEIRPGDPIIVNFTEPLDRNSIKQAVNEDTLTLNNTTDFSWHLDGATLVIRPEGGLQYGENYNLSIPASSAVTDLAGNRLDADFSGEFTMPGYASGGTRSPIVLTAYPGYPCANTVGTDASSLTTGAQGDTYQGRSLGGQSGDDLLTVMDLPANRPIRVQFSQVMNTSTITAGGSFVVQQSGDGGTTWTDVPGRLEKDPRRVRFYPDEAWEDGVLYRYILRSDQIVDESGDNPLQTNLLQAPDPTAAGPDLVNYFYGAPETDAVFQVLRNLPTIDVNSNFVYDDGEDDPENSGSVADYVDVSNDPSYSDVVESGNYIVEENSALLRIGEETENAEAYFGLRSEGEEKPEDFLWYTHALNVEVVGPAEYDGYDTDYEGPAVKVNVYPTRLVGANMDMYIELFGMDWIWIDASTGPQTIRMRYQEDENGNRTQPITGWIKYTEPWPVFEIPVEVYLDAPYLKPALYGDENSSEVMAHNLHSYEFTLLLRGRVIFLKDGRMIIRQINTNAVEILVESGMNILGLEDMVKIPLHIPPGGNFQNYMQLPLKE
ncbi:MAG: Ig-like domain-containing protein [Desulfobacterales bacterium]